MSTFFRQNFQLSVGETFFSGRNFFVWNSQLWKFCLTLKILNKILWEKLDSSQRIVYHRKGLIFTETLSSPKIKKPRRFSSEIENFFTRNYRVQNELTSISVVFDAIHNSVIGLLWQRECRIQSFNSKKNDEKLMWFFYYHKIYHK